MPSTNADADVVSATSVGISIGGAPSCAAAGCGFQRDMRALVFDRTGPGFGYDVFTVADASGAFLARASDEGSFSSTYTSTAHVVEVVDHTYYLDGAGSVQQPADARGRQDGLSARRRRCAISISRTTRIRIPRARRQSALPAAHVCTLRGRRRVRCWLRWVGPRSASCRHRSSLTVRSAASRRIDSTPTCCGSGGSESRCEWSRCLVPDPGRPLLSSCRSMLRRTTSTSPADDRCRPAPATRGGRGEGGVALITTLLLVGLLTAVGLGLTMLTMVETWLGAGLRASQALSYAADAGVNRVQVDLTQSADWTTTLVAAASWWGIRVQRWRDDPVACRQKHHRSGGGDAACPDRIRLGVRRRDCESRQSCLAFVCPWTCERSDSRSGG